MFHPEALWGIASEQMLKALKQNPSKVMRCTQSSLLFIQHFVLPKTQALFIVPLRTTLVIYNDVCQCKRENIQIDARRGRGRDERKDKQ